MTSTAKWWTAVGAENSRAGAIASGGNGFRAPVHKRPLTQLTKIVHPVCKAVVSRSKVRSHKLWNNLVPLGAVNWHGMGGMLQRAEPHINPSSGSQPSCHVPKGTPLLTSCWCYWGRRVLWGMGSCSCRREAEIWMLEKALTVQSSSWKVGLRTRMQGPESPEFPWNFWKAVSEWVVGQGINLMANYL